MQIGEIYRASITDLPNAWRICRVLESKEIYFDFIKKLSMYVYPDELFLNDKLKHVIGQIVLWYANDDRFKGDIKKSIMLRGNPGTGKTMIFEMFTEIIEYGDNKKPLYIHVRDLQNLYIKNDVEKIELLKNRFLIFIDDVGVEQKDINNYGTILEPFNDLYDFRYRKRLDTIISTNEPPEKLKEYYGSRTIDRFKESFNEYVFDFKSLRK